MFLRSFKLFVAALTAALLSVACGNGEPAPAPTAVAVSAGESSATVSWNMTDGVEYWVFFGPSSVTPATTATMQGWFGLPLGNVILKASSPYTVTGLLNGTNYSFSINARTNGGPGGPGSAAVTTAPRIAGANWQAASAVSAAPDLRSVSFGTTTATTTTVSVNSYVAAGAGGAIYSSPDGATWSAVNYASSANINAGAYFGTFKLVGDGGLVLLSSDAAAWTPQTSGTTQNLYAIASNSINLNVAVGANGTIISSVDGVTWTPASSSGTTRDLYAVAYSAYNNGLWLAVGAGGTMVQSTDGLTWTSVASNTQADLRAIAYGAIVSTSTDGVITATSAFVAVGASGTLLSSADGANWSAQTLPGAGGLNAVVYGTQFVTVGAGGKIFISVDGINWTPATSATSQNLYAVARGSLSYSAVGAAGTNLLSK
ncbi:MAG: fibronectin type III domain-containing protein [Comamonadaceae bacterium]